MAQITYRANLSAKTFPFISDNWGRTIIVPQYDNTFNRQVTSSEDQDKDVGIPQAYYMHNVMPHSQGFQSVGYTQLLNPSPDGNTDFKFITLIRDGEDNKVYLGITNAGYFYVNDGTGWIYKNAYSYLNEPFITYINGITYIWLRNQGCLKYDFTSGLFVSVTLTGLSIADTIGIASASGYLIAWSSDSVAWSSTIDPTDFTPSLVSGAGGGSVEGARGAINLCVTLTLGFIVYTTTNAVAALYSGNARYPFAFREIVGSGGLASQFLINAGAASGNHTAYTTSGLQSITTSSTSTILPDITDFISGKLFEDFDETTNTLSRSVLITTMKKRINLISDRYLVVSYGVNGLTHALVYDQVQKRYGKLKIPHVDTIEYQLPASGVSEIPRQSLGFLQADGTVKVVDFSVYADNSSGVLLLGKYQFIRPRLVTLDTVAVENIPDPSKFQLIIWSALDGKDNQVKPCALLSSSRNFQQYGARATGINHTLVCKGHFQLDSLVLQFHINGKR